jgi:hypothetical protein
MAKDADELALLNPKAGVFKNRELAAFAIWVFLGELFNT